MTTREVAAQIDAHLKRFEADPVINARPAPNKTLPYWQAGAHASGRFVRIIYVGYQSEWAVPLAEAKRYLDWLDAGNVGRHWACPEKWTPCSDTMIFGACNSVKTNDSRGNWFESLPLRQLIITTH